MIRFKIDELETSIERFENSLHVKSKSISAMIPSEDIRFQETENSDRNLLCVNSGKIEVMFLIPTNLVESIKSL